MTDTISRQAAIDTAIDAADDWDGGHSKERERFIREALEELPSAEPELKKGNEKCSNKLPCGWCSLFDTQCFGGGGEQDG